MGRALSAHSSDGRQSAIIRIGTYDACTIEPVLNGAVYVLRCSSTKKRPGQYRTARAFPIW